MRIHNFLAAGALVALLAACNDDPTGVQTPCDSFTNTVAGTQGDTITTTTGIRFIETRAGTGLAAETCRGVRIRYVLFVNGAEIERVPATSPGFIFYPGEHDVVPGFEQGVLGMKVGGTRRLFIPPALGYGANPVRNPQTNEIVIPANSTLVFDIELLEVEPR